MSRIMAVDYGDVRTGVALSDLTGSLAGQAQTLTLQGKALLTQLVALAQDNDVSEVVVGLPRNMDGSHGARAQLCQEFAQKLRNRGLQVVLRDERLTTVSAIGILNQHNVRGKERKGKIDAVAATLILQDYLDFRNNSVTPI